MISRSIVNKVRTELNPPGRFLEKNPQTGLWHEVDNKRAIEKAAQALRDGAAPLRKQLSLSESMSSDPSILDSLFDNSGMSGTSKDLTKSLTQPVSGILLTRPHTNWKSNLLLSICKQSINLHFAAHIRYHPWARNTDEPKRLRLFTNQCQDQRNDAPNQTFLIFLPLERLPLEWEAC